MTEKHTTGGRERAMSSMDYTVGRPTSGGYGTGYRQPVGTGLPGYAPGRFSTLPPVGPDGWCDEAGCPKVECVECKAAAR